MNRQNKVWAGYVFLVLLLGISQSLKSAEEPPQITARRMELLSGGKIVHLFGDVEYREPGVIFRSAEAWEDRKKKTFRAEKDITIIFSTAPLTTGERIYGSGGLLTYDGKEVSLKKNPRVIWEGEKEQIELTAEEILYYPAEKRIEARGKVLTDSGENRIYSDRATFLFKERCLYFRGGPPRLEFTIPEREGYLVADEIVLYPEKKERRLLAKSANGEMNQNKEVQTATSGGEK